MHDVWELSERMLERARGVSRLRIRSCWMFVGAADEWLVADREAALRLVGRLARWGVVGVPERVLQEEDGYVDVVWVLLR